MYLTGGVVAKKAGKVGKKVAKSVSNDVHIITNWVANSRAWKWFKGVFSGGKGSGVVKGASKKLGEGSQKLITNTGDTIPTIKHHILNAFHKPTKASIKYIKFFEDRGITRKIRDQWTVEIPVTYHKEWIHKAGRNWTTRWKRWIDANPNATAKDVYQQAGRMMDETGLSDLPLVPYK